MSILPYNYTPCMYIDMPYENEDSPSEIILLDCVLQLRSTVCALRRTPNARKLRQYIITNVLMYAIQADH